MNHAYYEAIGLEPSYSNGDLLEQVYDDRQLDEDETEELDWSIVEEEMLE